MMQKKFFWRDKLPRGDKKSPVLSVGEARGLGGVHFTRLCRCCSPLLGNERGVWDTAFRRIGTESETSGKCCCLPFGGNCPVLTIREIRSFLTASSWGNLVRFRVPENRDYLSRIVLWWRVDSPPVRRNSMEWEVWRTLHLALCPTWGGKPW